MLPVYTGGRGTLFRGARPEKKDLVGLRTVVNLEYGWFEFLHGRVAQEKEWCKTYSVLYQERRMSDFTSPEPEDLRQTVAILKNQLSFGSVLVHCLHGEDRTGMVVAAWRIIEEGWSHDQAVREMFDHGFHRWAYWHWVPALGSL